MPSWKQLHCQHSLCRYRISCWKLLPFAPFLCSGFMYCLYTYLVYYSHTDIQLLPLPAPVIEPKLGKNKLFLLVLTASTPWSYEERDALRNTWGSYKTPSSLEWKMVFNIGLYSAWWDSRIRKEASAYNDILVVDVNESYRNLIIKVFAALTWASNVKCKFVLKSDDDIYIHIPNLVKWLQSPSLPRQLYAGVLAIGTHIDRLPWKKHFLSYKTFNASLYPPYPRGHIYVLSHDLLPSILSSISRYEPFPIEDAYLGLLVNGLGIKPVAVPGCPPSSNNIRKLKSFSDCFYKLSICVGDSLDPYDLYYANARYSSAFNMQLTCSEQDLMRIPYSH